MRRSHLFLLVCLSLALPRLARADVPLPDSVGAPPQDNLVQIEQPEVPAADLIYDDATTTSGFDWRDPSYQIHLAGQPGFSNVQSPFWLPVEGLEDQDYEPADGWELMARNFGTSDVGVDVPFLILYNKYRGTVRLIAYINSVLRENFTSGRVTMRFANGGSTTKNLNQRSVLQPLNHYVSEAPISLINLQVGWNYADFTVEYDPDVHSVLEPLFVFDIDGLSTNNISLGGLLTTTSKGSVGITNAGQTAYQQLQTLVKNLNKAQTTFATTAEALNAWNTWEATLNDPKQKVGYQNVINLLKNGKDPLTLVVGLIDLGVSFFGGSKANSQPQNSTTISNLALEGTMTAQKNVAEILIRVPGANHNGKLNALPVWDYPLGVMAIVNSPSATYSTSGSAYNSTFLNTPCSNCVYLTGFEHMDILQLNGPVTYAINTSFPGALTPRSVEAAWSFSAPHRRPDAPPGYWSPITPPVYTTWVNNLVDAGRLVVIGSADLYHMGFNEYRTQFVPIDQFQQYKPEISRNWLRAEPNFSQHLSTTPPVQVRVRFARPGGTPANDLILVKSYDLFWPTSFPSGPEPWNLPSVVPVWAEPVAPLQAVTAPAAGVFIPRAQPWQVQWTVQGGSIDSVEAWLSSDNGSTFPTQLGRQLENSGTMSVAGVLTVGTQYRVRVRTRNGPTNADAINAGPFTIWGPTGTSASISSVCVAGASKAHLVVNWNTNVATAGLDKIDVTAPGGASYSATKSLGGATTTHSITLDTPCALGTFAYTVTSTLNGVEAKDDPRTIANNAACPTDCTPPAAITNLAFGAGRNSGVVAWTSPGDDGNTGQATAYDLRYSVATPITDANFSVMSQQSLPFTPAPAGNSQCVTLSLSQCSQYYWAIKTQDDAGNWSDISNLPHATTRCSGSIIVMCDDFALQPPGPQDDAPVIPATLEFAGPTPNPATGPMSISYGIPMDMGGKHFDISVFDIGGRKLGTVASGEAIPGRQTLSWNLGFDGGARIHSGTYFLRLSIGQTTRVQRLVLVR